MLHFVTHLPLSYINRVHVVLRSRPVRPCPIASDEWVRACRFNYPRFSCMVSWCRGIICRRIVQFQGETEIKKARLDLDDNIGDDGDAIEFSNVSTLIFCFPNRRKKKQRKASQRGETAAWTREIHAWRKNSMRMRMYARKLVQWSQSIFSLRFGIIVLSGCCLCPPYVLGICQSVRLSVCRSAGLSAGLLLPDT